MRKFTKYDFIEQAKSIHGTKYNYDNINYIDTVTKIEILCPLHGVFIQKPHHHIHRKHGCMKCAKIKMGDFYRKDTEHFIEKAKNIHGEIYDYSKTNYIGVFKKLIIICPIHGEFIQIADGHLAGKGCIPCGIETNSNNKIEKGKSQFIERARVIHGNTYEYLLDTYIRNDTKMSIICKKHNVFFQAPSNHLAGKGCIKCSNNVSKGEIEWLDSINISNRQVSLPDIGDWRTRVDGYNPDTNTVYQYHGDFWHGNPKKYKPTDKNPRTKCTMGELYEKTILRNNMIKDTGYNLVVMWESDWKIINQSPIAKSNLSTPIAQPIPSSYLPPPAICFCAPSLAHSTSNPSST